MSISCGNVKLLNQICDALELPCTVRNLRLEVDIKSEAIVHVEMLMTDKQSTRVAELLKEEYVLIKKSQYNSKDCVLYRLETIEVTDVGRDFHNIILSFYDRTPLKYVVKSWDRRLADYLGHAISIAQIERLITFP